MSKLKTKGKGEVDALINYMKRDIFFIIHYSGFSFLLCLLVAVGYMKGYKNTWLIFLALFVSLFNVSLFGSSYIQNKAYFRYLIHKNKRDIFFIILYSGISFLLCLLVAVGYMICYKNTWLILVALLVSLFNVSLFGSSYFRYLIHKNKE